MLRRLKDKDLPEIKELYLVRKLSSPQIGQSKGCSSTTVLRFLERNNISRRNGCQKKYTCWDDLYRLYIEQGLTLQKIAEIKGCSRNTVMRALQVQNIPRRLSIAGNSPQWHKKYIWDYEELKELYLKQKLSAKKIAEMKNASQLATRRALRRAGINLRRQCEANRLSAADGFRTGRYTGKRIDGQGYVRIYDRKAQKTIMEHVLVWEHVHNKRLPKGWVIHHLNGIPSDNRPENLVALPSQKHRLVLAEKAKRIRELEMKIKLLERALDSQQLIWWSDN